MLKGSFTQKLMEALETHPNSQTSQEFHPRQYTGSLYEKKKINNRRKTSHVPTELMWCHLCAWKPHQSNLS